MKLDRVIKNLHGVPSMMSYPPRELVDALPKTPDGNPDVDKLPRETVKNVIINCLSNYPVKDRKEALFVNVVAQAIIGEDGEIDLKEKYKKFLVEVLYTMMAQVDDKGQQSGTYFSWVIVQVLDELGVDVKLED